ncbi:helix-turn-helix transcriptional regulator [Vineibacter terrae]|uniref:Helix-turn-helix transcriptional regulator n=1 Tax=Vineibacter terrae TaxID=2586908 RepID=A0A5C8PR42_9HYPH|nr:helix-turn-helix transcriptional regulator [Vineibacter terrae]TXL78265.1 helix-turn-helix transcriptional regulator [Vineibacter terrae]
MNKPLHQFLAKRIDESGLTHREIADAIGYSRSNIVAMIKMGEMRLPISKIPALADVLGMERVELLRLALAEYQPEMLETINQVIREAVSENERRLLAELRKMIGGSVPALATAKQREKLKALAEALTDSGQAPPPSPRYADTTAMQGPGFGSWGSPSEDEDDPPSRPRPSKSKA